MKLSCNRLLVLAPHTDDAELGCGGTIARFLSEGTEVYVAVFSAAEESLPVGSSRTQLRDEFMESMKFLGVPQKNLFVYGYRVRHLAAHRQEVLETLIQFRRTIKPDMVLAPAGSDVHQDHQVMHAEGLRAFKDMTIWGYELPWNHINFCANAFVTLEKQHIDAKYNSLLAYRSQIELGRSYFNRDFIEGLARVRGVQVKAAYAEAFELVRIIT